MLPTWRSRVAVRFDAVTKDFARTRALDQLTLKIRHGEVLGLLGPASAGKTTALRILLGTLRPTTGSVTLAEPGSRWNGPQALCPLAYIPSQLPLWPELDGRQILSLLERRHRDLDSAYRDTLFDDFDLRDPHSICSAGDRRRMTLAVTLAARAQLLVLDEPAANLEPQYRTGLWLSLQEAKRRGQTVVLASRRLADLQDVCDRVAVLRRGRLADIGTVDDLGYLQGHTLEAPLEDAAPDLTGIDGIHVLQASDGLLRLHAHEPAASLLEQLRAAGLTQIAVRESSLEELLLAYYGPEPADGTSHRVR